VCAARPKRTCECRKQRISTHRKTMAILGVIPARKGSTRFPNKHHVSILGKPLFTYTLDAALAATRLDMLVISSDDLKLKALAKERGVEFIQRPSALCEDASALDDALRHSYRFLEARDQFRPDIIVNLHAVLPVRKPGQIDEVIDRLESMPGATAVCTAGQVRKRPEWAKVIVNEQTGEAAPFMPGRSPYRTQDFPGLYAMDGAVLAVRTKTLMETEGDRSAHAWLGSGLYLVVQDDPMYSLEVDYPDETALAAFYLLYQRRGVDWLHSVTEGASAKIRPAVTSCFALTPTAVRAASVT